MNKQFRAHKRSVILVPLLVMTLSGCANIAGIGGTDHFACKAPAGVQCNSVSGNYANALQNNLPGQKADRRKQDDRRAEAATATPRPVTAPTGDGMFVEPLRSRGRQVRLWINKWEDQEHDLVDQSFVYMQLDNGRWLVDHARARTRDTYAPLRAVKAPSRANAGAPAQPLRPQEVPFQAAAPQSDASASPAN